MTLLALVVLVYGIGLMSITGPAGYGGLIVVCSASCFWISIPGTASRWRLLHPKDNHRLAVPKNPESSIVLSVFKWAMRLLVGFFIAAMGVTASIVIVPRIINFHNAGMGAELRAELFMLALFGFGLLYFGLKIIVKGFPSWRPR